MDPEQESIAGVLTAFDAAAATADVAVVGCGPAGLALAAQLARQGLGVVLVGRDSRFVNNYGVWLDEFEDLGLRHTLNAVWDDAVCYFQEGAEVRVGRAYGRVCRRRLRKQLLQDCADAGVAFFPAEVEDIQAQAGAQLTSLRCAGGAVVRCRWEAGRAGCCCCCCRLLPTPLLRTPSVSPRDGQVSRRCGRATNTAPRCAPLLPPQAGHAGLRRRGRALPAL